MSSLFRQEGEIFIFSAREQGRRYVFWRSAKALRDSGRRHVRRVCDPQGLALRDAEFGR